MHSDEVRNPQVAGDGAPAEEREPRAAVRDADGVRTDDALEGVELCGGRPGHQEREAHPDHGDHAAGPDRE
ncbi:hypothetical protein KIV56_05575 [Cryobacterium breve]|uniref:Uncharacterized protein n=1 Tax=Cryobacterium breve TaxID=1259258 RepID=A0ABY7NGX6_9MICO|nr:hypothetical protein [Cryobacterium breve]WBM80804.1 hypothetical protein KIV56_05575 [Cryobacterium breve]